MAGHLLVLSRSSSLIELFGTVLDELIHESECLNECITILFVLVTLEFFEFIEEFSLHKLTDLMS